MSLKEMYDAPYGVLHALYYRFWKENDEREKERERQAEADKVDGKNKTIQRKPPIDMISDEEVMDILDEVGI